MTAWFRFGTGVQGEMNLCRWVSVALAVALSACGGSSPSAPTSSTAPAPAATPSKASITLAANPSSVVATCATGGSLCAAGVAVTVSESAGVGGNVDFITTSFRTTAGTVADTINVGATAIIGAAGTNHVAPNGRLTVGSPTPPFVIVNIWTRAGIGTVGVMAITLQFTDDRGNVLTATVNVPVS